MSEIEGLFDEETCVSYVSRSTVSTELCEGVDGGTSWSDDGLSNSANVSLQLTVDVSREVRWFVELLQTLWQPMMQYPA